MSVQITKDGMEIDGKPFPLYSGSVQPWRLDPSKWGEILDRVGELGFGCIEVYVPWSAHELSDGSCDFSGSRDIGAFLDLAHERGLKAIVRPGPHANAEMTGFGYPDRILRDPEMHARRPEGNPAFVPTPPKMFPVVSYAGGRLYREFEEYLTALAPVLKKRLHPNGPIVALQADNEMTLFFRTGAFDLDYSDAAVAEYRDFIKEKYPALKKLNRAYGTKFKSFGQLDPPVKFEAETVRELPRYLDWIEFKEAHLKNAVGRVAKMFKNHGLEGVPVTHNYPLGHLRPPLDLCGLEQVVDLVGMDMYYRRGDYYTIKARCQALCGLSRFPYAPEFGSGSHFAWPPVDLEDQVFATLSAAMHGLRGFNFYMLVDRERWYGAPVRRDGSVDPDRAEVYRRLTALFARTGGCRRFADTVLLSTRLYGRLENLSNVFDPLSPMALAGLGLDAAAWCGNQKLGLKNPPASTHARLQEDLFWAMSEARLAFDLSEPGRPAGGLQQYRLAVLPTLEIMEHKVAVDLLSFVRSGGTLVMGPEVPGVDETGRPDRTVKSALEGRGEKVHRVPAARLFQVGLGRIVVLKNLLEQAKDPQSLARLLGAAGGLAGCQILPEPGDSRLDTAWHPGEPDLLWLANPTAEERTAKLAFEEAARLTDLFREESFQPEGGFNLPMPPHCVRPLEVSR